MRGVGEYLRGNLRKRREENLTSSGLSTHIATGSTPYALPPAAWATIMLSGLLLLPLQFIQIGIAQPSHLWAVLVLALLIQRGQIQVSVPEVLVYVTFFGSALIATFLGGYPHFKATEQLMKFGFLYPAFFLIGRALGAYYLGRALPYAYMFLWALLGVEYLVQVFEVPYLHKTVDFMQDALYGTFKERNWLAIYFFLASYLLFLRSPRRAPDLLNFAGIVVVVMLLSGSKTILIPCGIVVMLHYPGRGTMKLAAVAGGAALYIWLFGHELTGDLLRVRLEDERGLAFMQSAGLVAKEYLGYGFGFVEAHFSSLWFSIKGLGPGTNSIFLTPLDFMIIAGIPGLIFWGVYFAGAGLRSMALLAPIASWSLTNPLHQSETVYFFMGMLVAWGMRRAGLSQAKADQANMKAMR